MRVWCRVATNTSVRSQTIDDFRMAAHQPSLLMTSITGHIRVPSRKGKRSAFVVIESRRRPALRVVAVFALRFAVFRELPAMRIGVTILAICRDALENY